MKKILCFMLASTMMFAVAGCGSSPTSSSGSTKKTITIGISMDAIESQMWVENQTSMHKTADSLGVKYVEVIADGDAQKQNQQIDTLIASKVDAIIIAPKDGTAIVSAIKKANAAGIPVIMNNRAAAEGANVTSTISSDNETMVQREMKYVLDKANTASKTYTVLKLIGGLTDVNAVARDKGFKDVADANTNVFKVVSSVPTDWKAELALSGTLNAFQAHPDINMIFSPSDALLPAIESALKQLGKWYPASDLKHVTIVTFDGAKEAVTQIKAKYVDIVSVQDATVQGKLCMENAVKAAKGETVEKNSYDPGFEVNIENVETKGFNGF